MRSREDLSPAEPTIEPFLTDLAVHRNVAAATQNQAMNALVFLYKRVLDHAMEGSINAVRADKKINVPVVMTRDEVAAVISLLDGTAHRWFHNLLALTAVWAVPTGPSGANSPIECRQAVLPSDQKDARLRVGACRDCSW